MSRDTTAVSADHFHPQIETGLFARLPGRIRDLSGGGRVFVITDSNVLRLYGRGLLRGMVSEGLDAILLEIIPGEVSKSARTASALQTQLLAHGVDRKSLVILLGGGVVGDVGGFAAATAMRGLRYVQVPTTLLAQVDSSIGGKVGINHPLGKNLIGSFATPIAVLTDPLLLRTLSVGEIRNGLAEVVKISFACDPSFFRWLKARGKDLAHPRQEMLVRIVREAAGLKAGIVGKDPLDEGMRRILNFGHTIGHAIEAASGYQMRHGFAVSIGMVREASIAVSLGLLRQNDCDLLRSLLRSCRLPVEHPRTVSRPAFLRALGYDKKRVTGAIHLPLPTRVGKMRPAVEVPYDMLIS